MYCGDYLPGDTIDFKFTTIRPSTGAPFTLAGTPALSVYKNNSTTQTTTGVTLTVDFDSVTGLNHVRIVTSDAFYVAGDNYDVVITTGTVDSVSAVGYVVGRFSLAKVAALRPATAGRTLDVSAAGLVSANTTQLAGQTVTAAGAVTFPSTVSSLTASGVRTELSTELGRIDVATSTRLASSAYTTPPTAGAIADAVWDETIGDHLTAGSTGAALNAAGSAGDPWTTTLPGSYTGSQAGKILADILVDTGTTLQAEVDDIQSRLPAALVSGRMDASIGAMAANTMTASALATDAVTEIVAGVWNALTASYTVSGSFGERVLRGKTTQAEVQVNGNGHVASVLHSSEPDSITVGAFAANSITAAALASDAATEIATATLGATVEGSETLTQVLRLVRASTVGRSSGFPGGPGIFRDAANTKDRITATFDADGNRTNVTTDAT